MGFAPLYRKAVVVARVGATVASISVATVAGSGGNPPDRVTVRVTVSALVAESVAITTIVFWPTDRSTSLLKAPFVTDVATPFTVTSFNLTSLAVPATVTVGVDTVAPSTGVETVSVGRTVS